MLRGRILGPASRVVLAGLVGLACARPDPPPATESATTTSPVDGAPIAYRSVGHGEPALVFVHGWTCDQTHWRYQIDHFAVSHRVITVDLAGHGQSGRGHREWTIRNFAADVVAAVDAADAHQVVLVGHSLGGAVAVEAAHLLPDRAVGVVGVDTFFDVWGDSLLFARVLDGLRSDWPKASREFVQSMFTPASDTALVAWISRGMTEASPEVAIPALAGVSIWWRSRFDSAMTTLRVPVGAIQAAADGHQRLEAHRRSLPLLETAVMPGLGHFVMLEDPVRFNEILDRQLDRLVPRPRP